MHDINPDIHCLRATRNRPALIAVQGIPRPSQSLSEAPCMAPWTIQNPESLVERQLGRAPLTPV
jgi:hypothetical protein